MLGNVETVDDGDVVGVVLVVGELVSDVVAVVLVVAVVVRVVVIRISHLAPVYHSGQMHRHPRYGSSSLTLRSSKAALPSSSSL